MKTIYQHFTPCVLIFMYSPYHLFGNKYLLFVQNYLVDIILQSLFISLQTQLIIQSYQTKHQIKDYC